MPHKHTLPPLSEAQLEIMHVVWDGGEVTVSEVWETLSRQRDIARNTVQTTMVRLAEKGWLRHRRTGKAFLYSAAAPREATQKNMVKRLLDQVFGGSTEGLVMALLEEQSLSPEEARRIRRMLNEATQRNRSTAP